MIPWAKGKAGAQKRPWGWGMPAAGDLWWVPHLGGAPGQRRQIVWKGQAVEVKLYPDGPGR